MIFGFEALMGGTSASDPILTVWNVGGASEYSGSLRALPSSLGSSQAVRARYSVLVTGLTAGSSYTFGPGFAISSPGNSVSIYVGHSPSSPPYGPGLLTITTA